MASLSGLKHIKLVFGLRTFALSSSSPQMLCPEPHAWLVLSHLFEGHQFKVILWLCLDNQFKAVPPPATLIYFITSLSTCLLFCSFVYLSVRLETLDAGISLIPAVCWMPTTVLDTQLVLNVCSLNKMENVSVLENIRCLRIPFKSFADFLNTLSSHAVRWLREETI